MNKSYFTINDTIGYNKSKHSAQLNSINSRVADVDDMISPSIDLSGKSGLYYNFKYAYATSTTKITDMIERLTVFYTIDCGKTWNQLWTADSTLLINNGFYSTEFFPDYATKWSDISIPLPTAAMSSNIRFKFEFKAGVASNDLYIDNVNVSIYSGISSINNLSFETNLYPNPTSNGYTDLRISLKNSSITNISICDVQGVEIAEILNNEVIAPGINTYNINTSQFAKGIYFLKININGQILVRKLVVQ